MRRLTKCAIVLAAVSACVAVYAVDPEEATWMPRCVFHALTGLDCPSCGSTRAMHHLLHGDIDTGLRYNPFILIAMPMFVAVIFTTVWDNNAARRLRPWVQHPVTIYVFSALLIVWWIVRNLLM